MNQQINFNSKIAICGIVKDRIKTLRYNTSILEKLLETWPRAEVVLYEDGSTDGTREFLVNWTEMNSSRRHLLPILPYNENFNLSDNFFFSRRRIDKISFCRNRYLEYISNDDKWDYVFIIDLDIRAFDLRHLVNSMNKPGWDAIFCNGVTVAPNGIGYMYYDAYATILENGPAHQSIRNMNNLQHELRFIHKKKKLYRVRSAFGGFGVYRYEAIKGLKYAAMDNSDDEVEVHCEHVNLHQKMSSRGFDKLFIAPWFKVKHNTLLRHWIKAPDVLLRSILNK